MQPIRRRRNAVDDAARPGVRGPGGVAPAGRAPEGVSSDPAGSVNASRHRAALFVRYPAHKGAFDDWI